MKKLIAVFVSLLFCLGFSTAAMTDPFQNGSFEEGPDSVDPFLTLSEGDTSITGWRVSDGSIDLIGNYWAASDGDRSIDLNGDVPGAISQEFDTEPGFVYHVLFDMAGNPDSTGLKVLVISANSDTAEYEFDNSSLPPGDMGWTEMSFVFQASDYLTTLEFASITPDAWGPALDNVRVIPIGPFPLDSMHPTGAVHAYPNLLWPPNNKKVDVKIKGYVLDEMSMSRDGNPIRS